MWILSVTNMRLIKYMNYIAQSTYAIMKITLVIFCWRNGSFFSIYTNSNMNCLHMFLLLASRSASVRIILHYDIMTVCVHVCVCLVAAGIFLLPRILWYWHSQRTALRAVFAWKQTQPGTVQPADVIWRRHWVLLQNVLFVSLIIEEPMNVA